MMKQDVATKLNPILDARGHMVLNEKDNEFIERHKDAYMIISMNPFSAEFTGTKPLNAAFRSNNSINPIFFSQSNISSKQIVCRCL